MENPVISREYVEKNYIHKDELRAKKQELEDYIQENSDEQGYWGRITQEEIYTQIDIIDELLEETEDENNNTNNDSFKKEQSADINK